MRSDAAQMLTPPPLRRGRLQWPRPGSISVAMAAGFWTANRPRCSGSDQVTKRTYQKLIHGVTNFAVLELEGSLRPRGAGRAGAHPCHGCHGPAPRDSEARPQQHCGIHAPGHPNPIMVWINGFQVGLAVPHWQSR
jgi:hypothetical protein